MARIVGADTAYPVTNALIAKATSVLQEAPAFWGRYFTSPQTAGTVEYRHVLENPILSAAGIRVLPIARQTNDVSGTGALGYSDGAKNAADLIATFGADYLAESNPAGVAVFLDVEGSGRSHLSTDYYMGWAAGLGHLPQLASAIAQVSFLPCVYGIPGDAVTWTALARAIANGVGCGGLWMARPVQKAAEPVLWNVAAVAPAVDPGAPVLLWQYMFPRDGAALDRSQVSPEIDAQNDLLRYLVLPPGAVAASASC